jgi:uncharacterized protein
MTKVEAITALQRRAEALQALRATSLYLFGSVVRDEAKPASDLDLFIDYDRDGRFNAFDLVGIKQYLENELSVDIDVTTRDGLHLVRNPTDKDPGLLLEFTIEDPGVFTTPWSARITHRRPLGSRLEFVWAESTRDYVGRTINLQHADKPDF